MKDDLDAYLEGSDALSSLYAETQQTPTTDRVDNAVLAAAKRELSTAPVLATTVIHGKRWVIPLSTAAVVVLSATLWVMQTPTISHLVAPVADNPAQPAALQEVKQAKKAQTQAATPSARVKSTASAEIKEPTTVRADPSTESAVAEQHTAYSRSGLNRQATSQETRPAAPMAKLSDSAPALAASKQPELPNNVLTLEQIKALIDAGHRQSAQQALIAYIRANPLAELPDWARGLQREKPTSD